MVEVRRGRAFVMASSLAGVFLITVSLMGVFNPIAVTQETLNQLTEDEKREGWKLLFNGYDLSGWVVMGNKDGFYVKDGAIRSEGGKGGYWLRSEQQYGDFILKVEWRVSPKGNSGVFIRCPEKGNPWETGIEVQITNEPRDELHCTGSLYGLVPVNPRPDESADKWHQFEIHCAGKRIVVLADGVKCVDAHMDKVPALKNKPMNGYIGLQDSHAPAPSYIEFRNIKLKDLNAILGDLLRLELPDNVPPPGFTALFNGKDLSGWKVDDEGRKHWVVKDGVIDYDGKWRDLWTEKEFEDFILIVDWRWSGKPTEVERPIILPNGDYARTPDGKTATQRVLDAGDSGIYLRGSSKSQINIWCWPCGSGEIYGYRTDPKMPPEVRAKATPKLNADNPIGEWNRFIIIMRGERVTVFLNNLEVISDAPLPGVPKKGPIALQHHGSPIQFKNIFIKELPKEG
ncbi:MAG: hypothetical protein GDYSWBUE_001941 [Candidatus Fervidibacterota bacterium]